jgi:GDPmannose 4,6-dehydratase
MKHAIVTGAGGQDGSYLCELLIEQGYKVGAIVRIGGNPRYLRPHPNLRIYFSDIRSWEIQRSIIDATPDELYHLANPTHVRQSYDDPESGLEVGALVTTRLLEGLRKRSPRTRVYHAGSSEMFPYAFGNLGALSPYAVGKVAAHLMAGVYRDAHDMFVVSGIAYNHESARRPPRFVTMKLACAALRYKQTGARVRLGHVTAQRDWHHAKDTARGMWMALQGDEPLPVVFASGVARSVEQLAHTIFDAANVRYEDVVETTGAPEIARPLDPPLLLGRPLPPPGWALTISFEEMVQDLLRGAPDWMADAT